MARLDLSDPIVIGLGDEDEEETPAERERRLAEEQLAALHGTGDAVAAEGAAAMLAEPEPDGTAGTDDGVEAEEEPATGGVGIGPTGTESAAHGGADEPETHVDSEAHENALIGGDDGAEVWDASMPGRHIDPEAIDMYVEQFQGRPRSSSAAAPAPAPSQTPAPLPMAAPPRTAAATRPAAPGDDVDGVLASLRRQRVRNPLQMLGDVLRGLGGQQPRPRPDPADDMEAAQRIVAQRGAQQRQRAGDAEEERAAAERRDPNSQRNQTLRQLASQRLGVPVPDSLTEDDVASLGLINGIAAARDRDAQTRLLEAGRNNRNDADNAQDTTEAAARREMEQQRIEIARQRLDLTRQRLERRSGRGGGRSPSDALSPEEQAQTYVDAQVAAGGNAENARRAWAMLDGRHRQNALVQALAGERTATRAGERQGQQEEARDLTRGTNYHRALEQAGIPRGEAALSHAEGLLRSASDGVVREALLAVNNPDRMAALSGAGGEHAQAAQLAQAIQAISNVELKNQSGAAVSDQEFSRFQAAAGSGSLSAALMRSGIAALRRMLDAQRRNIDAGYSDVVGREGEESVQVTIDGRPATLPRRNLARARARYGSRLQGGDQ